MGIGGTILWNYTNVFPEIIWHISNTYMPKCPKIGPFFAKMSFRPFRALLKSKTTHFKLQPIYTIILKCSFHSHFGLQNQVEPFLRRDYWKQQRLLLPIAEAVEVVAVQNAGLGEAVVVFVEVVGNCSFLRPTRRSNQGQSWPESACLP